MIIDDILKFNTDVLVKVPSDQRQAVLKDFLIKHPEFKMEKLPVIIKAIRHRQHNKMPYAFPWLYRVLTILLIIAAFFWLNTLSLGNAFDIVKQEAQMLLITMAVFWVILYFYRKYVFLKHSTLSLNKVLTDLYIESPSNLAGS